MSAITPDKDGASAAKIAREATNKALEDAGFTDKNIFRELAIISFSDLRKFINEDGNLKKLSELSPLKISKAVKKIKHIINMNTVTGIETTRTEYELYDKLPALNMAIAIKGIKAPEKIQFPDKDGNPQSISKNFSDTELAAQVIFMLEQAAEKEKAGL